MIFNPIQKILKKNTINILMLSLIIVMMGIGSCATVPRTTLQDRTMYISLGQRSTWDHQILGRQTESFTTFGRRARQIGDLMECATSRIDGLGLALWRPQRLLTWQQLPRTLDLVSYLRLEQMQRRCLQTRLYPYQSIIHFSSNPYKTVWNDRRRSFPIRYRQEDLPETPSKRPIVRRNLGRGSIQQSIGRTRETTRMMERNYNSSSTTNRANGRGRTTYSTTGGSQRRASGLEHE